jgi:hypothetical protein
VHVLRMGCSGIRDAMDFRVPGEPFTISGHGLSSMVFKGHGGLLTLQRLASILSP